MTRSLRYTTLASALLVSSLAQAQMTQEAQADIAPAVSIAFFDGTTESQTILSTFSDLSLAGTNNKTFTLRVRSTSGYTISASTDMPTMTEWDTSLSTPAYTARALASPIEVTVGAGTQTPLGTVSAPVYTSTSATTLSDLPSELYQPVGFGDADLPSTSYYKVIITYTIAADAA